MLWPATLRDKLQVDQKKTICGNQIARSLPADQQIQGKLKMSMQKRLMMIFLGCGLVPLAFAAAASYFLASRGVDTVAKEADLEARVKDSLHAQRALKRAQLEDYFHSIRDQIITFSSNPATVGAMRSFRESFEQHRDQLNLSKEQLETMKRELASYYNNSFASEYREQNHGRQPNTGTMLRLDDDSVALQHAYIYANPNPLGSKHLLDSSRETTKYNRVHGGYHSSTRQFLEKFDYYDIFLVDIASGDILYSVFKELDYTTSLLDGPYASSNLGDAYRQARDLNDPNAFVFVDYKQYTPSYEAPASFIASPIFDGTEKIGVAIFQMPLDRISSIMSHRDGLGESGETILVGPDNLLRSDSYHDSENRTVVASFRNPEKAQVKLDAIQSVFDNGGSGAIVTNDYRGIETLNSYGPVDALGVTWCLNAKMDTAEAFEELNKVAVSIQRCRSSDFMVEPESSVTRRVWSCSCRVVRITKCFAGNSGSGRHSGTDRGYRQVSSRNSI